MIHELPCKDCKLYKVCTISEELRDRMVLGYVSCGDHEPLNIIHENHKFPYEIYPVRGVENYSDKEKFMAQKIEALKKAEELYNTQFSQRDKGEESMLRLRARLNDLRSNIVQLLRTLELLIGDE